MEKQAEEVLIPLSSGKLKLCRQFKCDFFFQDISYHYGFLLVGCRQSIFIFFKGNNWKQIMFWISLDEIIQGVQI